jgi:hypothetical protein
LKEFIKKSIYESLNESDSSPFNLNIKEVSNGYIIESYTSKGPVCLVIEKESMDNSETFKRVLECVKDLYENITSNEICKFEDNIY